MKINLSIEIVPFEIPTKVYIKQPPGLRQDGIKALASIPLNELSIEVLMELCDDFKCRIMEQQETLKRENILQEYSKIYT